MFGPTASRIAAVKPLRELDLVALARGGDPDAIDHLVQAHMRLVVAIARRYVGQGLALPDLVQEGAIGLIRAIEKYDPERGTRFATYATWWVRQSIDRAVANKGRAVRLPVGVVGKLQRVRRAQSALAVELGRDPEPPEVSARAGLSEGEIEQILASSQAVASLDSPLAGDWGTLTLGERIADASASAAFDAVESQLSGVDPWLLLHALAPLERRVLELRLGLTGPAQTRGALAERFQLTRVAIRRIEYDALGKLRLAAKRRAA